MLMLESIRERLGLYQWENEPDGHFKGRCVYSAVGRSALFILYDEETPDAILQPGQEPSPPEETIRKGFGSISFLHFWKRLDLLLVSFRTFLPEAFESESPIQNLTGINNSVFDKEARDFGAENYDGLEQPSSDKVFRRWERWVFDRYMNTGFLYHQPRRLSPAQNLSATFHGCTFLRGSHTEIQNVRMSGLAMFTNETEVENSPFSNLFLLPPKRNNSGSRAPILFAQSGNETTGIVRFTVPFKLPPEEQELVWLCSWPQNNGDFESMICRTATPEAFHGLYEELTALGYSFQRTQWGNP